MHAKLLTAAVLITLGISPGFAQNSAGLPVGKVIAIKTLEGDIDRDLKEYLAMSQKSDARALDKLMGIGEKGLARSAGNLGLLVNIIGMQVPVEQRTVAIALLASLYTLDGSSSLNWQIAQQLRILAASGEKAISNAALLRYSRLGYFPDTRSLLQFNVARRFITAQDMLGELAHLVVFAPATEQLRLVQILAAGKNRYATDIAISNLKSIENRQKLAAEAKLSLLSLLEQEPKYFSTEPRAFDLMEAIAYSNWLHSFAALSEDVGRANYVDVVMANLIPENVDPRKVIAFFLAQEGKLAANRIPKTQLQTIINKVSAFQGSQTQQDGVRQWSSNVIGYLSSVR